MSKSASAKFLRMLVALGLVAGCGSSNSFVVTPPAPTGPSLTVSGRVAASSLTGSTVRAYHVQPGGKIGELAEGALSYPVPPPEAVASATPAPDGSFQLALPDGRPVYLRLEGGTYQNGGGAVRPVGPAEALSAVLPTPTPGTEVAVTPLSGIASRLALAHARAGVPVERAFREANQAVAGHFVLDSLLSPASDSDRNDVDIVLRALSRLAQDYAVDEASLREALASDLLDGRFDGRGAKGETLTVSSTLPAQSTPTSSPLPSTAGTSDLASAVQSVSATSPQPASAELVSSLSSSNGIVAAAPTAYVSPYTIDFSNTLESLTADFSQTPRDAVSEESSQPPFVSWYDVSAYPSGQLPWGPLQRLYPAPTVPAGADPVTWQRERVLATAMKYIGYDYQHHHVPDWDPAPYNWPQWISVSLGHNGNGIDCSDFSAWNYNYGLGVKLITAVANQAATTALTAPDGSPLTAQTLLQATSSTTPVDYATLKQTLVTGDLLYIRGEPSKSAPGTGITHVIMWVGDIGQSPDGTPLILDSHDNAPPVSDSNGVVIPAGVHLRPFLEGSWYHRGFDHAHRIISEQGPLTATP